MFSEYEVESFFDEMFSESGECLPHYAAIYNRFKEFSQDEVEEKQRLLNEGFLEQGVTFTVYGDAQGTERIFPFDVVPRIIPDKEWQVLEQGLTQRIVALNLFLNDIYHEGKILKDGVIPSDIIDVEV